ncbi:MAG TPA: trypsin-like serine protease, partial [Bdellovibrio sp.]|nr:trypsin-like serine protease [Bdellovibrio sp.]
LIKTAEADIALVFFPPKTFKHWIEIDRTEVLPGDHVSMYGFGFRNNSLVTPVLGPTLEKNGLSVSHSIVAERANDQRFSVLNSDSEKFADAGDSGGAVLRNNRLVGIISTREQKCEDRYGSDYAILNSIIRLNAKSTLSP